MIRNKFAVALTAFAAALLQCALPAAAQLPVGSWKQYEVFGNVTSLRDTKETVYAVTGGSLHSFSKSGGEHKFYAVGSDLTDYNVTNVFTNPATGGALVVFASGNMNYIDANGRMDMIPDIRDAQINANKVVNDVKFHNGRIYIATAFGLVVVNESTHRVEQSGIYNRSVRALDVCDNGILLIISASSGDSNHEIHHAPLGTRINKLENFKLLTKFDGIITDLVRLDEAGKIFAAFRWNGPYKMILNANGTANIGRAHPGNITGLIRGDNKVYFVDQNNKLCQYEPNGLVTVLAPMPDEVKGNLVCTTSGAESIWAADINGVGEYKVDADGNATTVHAKYKPSGAVTFSDAVNIFPTYDANGFFIMNLGFTSAHPLGMGDGYTVPMHLNKIVGGDVTNYAPTGVTSKLSFMQNIMKANPQIYGPMFVAQSPLNPERLFIGTGGEGVYVIENGVQIAKLDSENAAVFKIADYRWQTDGGWFDKDGNFWLMSYGDADNEENVLTVLPSAVAHGDFANPSAADWIHMKVSNFISGRENPVLLTRDGLLLMTNPRKELMLSAIDLNGTPLNPEDDRIAAQTTVVDQDGKTLEKPIYHCMVEDHNGIIWLGHDKGVFTVTNPRSIFTGDFRMNRVKVPRKDGSNLADYLLESDEVVCIAVDAANRKWIGTAASGLFLVSENGDEILANYTKDNSPLPGNRITSIYCNPTSNSVYVATGTGLFEFSATASPAKPDYSNVYAYPNPVTPDYTGLVTIAGLMDHSLVKIMDAQMHMVYQTTSEGGMAMWDCCNMNGERVRSGVYFVLASTGSQASGTAPAGDVVCKIMVVN